MTVGKMRRIKKESVQKVRYSFFRWQKLWITLGHFTHLGFRDRIL